MSVHINAGFLGERVTLQQRAAGVDSHGHPSTSWSDVAEVWAEVEPIRGREYFAAGQTQAPVDVRMRIRYRSDITPSMRAVWRSVPHDIVSVIDMGAQRVALELMCLSGGRDGR